MSGGALSKQEVAGSKSPKLNLNTKSEIQIQNTNTCLSSRSRLAIVGDQILVWKKLFFSQGQFVSALHISDVSPSRLISTLN